MYRLGSYGLATIKSQCLLQIQREIDSGQTKYQVEVLQMQNGCFVAVESKSCCHYINDIQDHLFKKLLLLKYYTRVAT